MVIDNDVKSITLAEWKYGAGKGVENCVCMTLGTGVGSGLILGGRLFRGAGNAAGEMGHMPLNEHGPACNCGGNGCLETYVGNKPLVALASEMMGKAVTLEDMYALACGGNKKALAFWLKAGTHIGNGLVGVVNLLNPNVIIIGGGVSHNHVFLFPVIRKVIKSRCMTTQAANVRVVRSQLKDDAGIIGGMALVRHAS